MSDFCNVPNYHYYLPCCHSKISWSLCVYNNLLCRIDLRLMLQICIMIMSLTINMILLSLRVDHIYTDKIRLDVIAWQWGPGVVMCLRPTKCLTRPHTISVRQSVQYFQRLLRLSPGTHNRSFKHEYFWCLINYLQSV